MSNYALHCDIKAPLAQDILKKAEALYVQAIKASGSNNSAHYTIGTQATSLTGRPWVLPFFLSSFAYKESGYNLNAKASNGDLGLFQISQTCQPEYSRIQKDPSLKNQVYNILTIAKRFNKLVKTILADRTLDQPQVHELDSIRTETPKSMLNWMETFKNVEPKIKTQFLGIDTSSKKPVFPDGVLSKYVVLWDLLSMYLSMYYNQTPQAGGPKNVPAASFQNKILSSMLVVKYLGSGYYYQNHIDHFNAHFDKLLLTLAFFKHAAVK